MSELKMPWDGASDTEPFRAWCIDQFGGSLAVYIDTMSPLARNELQRAFSEAVRFGAEQAREENARLNVELAEADRFVGAAKREIKVLRKESRARTSWLDKAKQDAGYSTSVSFDQVWADALQSMTAQKAQSERIRQLESALQTAKSDLLVMHDSPECASPLETVAMIDAVLKQEAK